MVLILSATFVSGYCLFCGYRSVIWTDTIRQGSFVAMFWVIVVLTGSNLIGLR